MSFINSIQSFLPRPENRSRDEIARDLDDEFAFHLEMKARAIALDEGVDRSAADALARARFGDVDRVRDECQRIALKERSMLQRVNFVMMLVVLLMVAIVGWQVLRTQSKTTEALQGILGDLARMKFEDLSARSNSAAPPFVYIDGDVQRPGVFSLPSAGSLTLSRMLTAAGVAKGRDAIKVMVSASDPDGKSIVRYINEDYALTRDLKNDYVLEPNDRVVVTKLEASRNEPPPRGEYPTAGRWIGVDKDNPYGLEGVHLEIINAEDIRNVEGQPIAVVTFPRGSGDLRLILNSPTVSGQNLQVIGKSMLPCRWALENDRLMLNIAAAEPTLTKPLVFVYAGDEPVSDSFTDARAVAVGDFVVRLFALADPRDPNLDQTVRDFLDAEERTVDQRYADDPSVAGMIRELIAARRKIFESDAAIQRAVTAEQKAEAVSDFFQDVLASADTTAPTISVSEVLESASRRIEEQFADNPELAAQMRERIAEAHRNLSAEKPAETAADQGEARQDDDQFPKIGLFRDVRWKDQWTPIVQFREQWYELVTLDGIAARSVVEHARQRHGENKARERCSEDLAQMLIEMNHRPGATAKLQVRDLESGSVLAINEAPWTLENRELILRANFSAQQAGREFVEWAGNGQ